MQDSKITLTALFLLIPLASNANLVWPSIYIVEHYYVWYVIVAALIIETFAAHIFLKTNWRKSIVTTFIINLISAILGLLLIPVSGIIVEVLTIPFGGGTFDVLHWILDYICMVFVNTCVEGLALKWIFKYPFKQNFLWLFGANLISVIISLIALLIKFSN